MTLFRYKRFALNEMFQWNASKCALFYVSEFFLFFHFMQLIYEEWWWCCPSINNFLRKLIHKSSSNNAATPVVSTLRLFTKVVCTVKVQKKLMLWYNLAIGTWTWKVMFYYLLNLAFEDSLKSLLDHKCYTFLSLQFGYLF